MRPAAIVATSTGNWNGGPQRDRLIAAAHTELANRGVQMSWTKVRRMVQMYERQAQRYGYDFGRYLDAQVAMSKMQRRADPDELRIVSYVDKTGETAVRNVMRSGARQ